MVINGTVGSRAALLSFALMLVWPVSTVCAADQSPGAQAYSYQKEILARVGAIQGDTKVQRAGEAKFKKISAKSPLYLMDFVATGSNSKLWWQGTFNAYSPSDKWKPGPDVTHGSLGADSVFGFKQFQRAGASYRFIGYVQKGTVRFIKTLPNTNPPSSFIMGPHTAWIEALSSDRAADFIVQSKNESHTTVTVLWGKVRVRNTSPEIKESRILTSCQEVDVERDQEPGEIKWVSTDTMKELVKRTTIPKTLPEDVPSCERLKTEVLLDVTAVFLPPPGVALYPAIVPVPVPAPGDKSECCPPGQIYNPRTGECRCPCPEGQLPPVVPRGGNGLTVVGQCGSCRTGATFNPQTCACECPCPQGFLLPGQGCVPQCPAGYSQAWDASSALPYRCLYCVPTGVVTDPIPPPLTQCRDGKQCGPCEGCLDGVCVSRGCRKGFYRDPVSCECLEVPNDVSRPCQSDTECSECKRCLNGQCTRTQVCSEGARLNPATCQCEPEEDTDLVRPRALGAEPQQCQNNSDCPPCQACSNGLCAQKLCPVGQRMNLQTCQCEPATGAESPPCQNNSDCPQCQTCSGGVCAQKLCPTGQRMNMLTCQCGAPCQNNSDCPQCQTCVNGLCAQRLCQEGRRMNLQTCQCEPVAPQCQNDAECPVGAICRKGKCIKLPTRRIDEPTFEPRDRTGLFPEDPTTPFPGGVGLPGRIRVGPGTPSQQVAPVQRVPRQVAPVQRVPPAPAVKPR